MAEMDAPLREYQPHVKEYLSSLLLPYHLHRNSNCLDLQQAQHIIVTRRVGHFLLNHVQRSLTSLLLRVILAHSLAKISDDAGAFILRSLVIACQRPPAPGEHRSIVADARGHEYEPGFRECVRYSAHFGICSKLALCSPFSLQRFYVRTSRQLKRIESTTRSLIYVHFSETIAGASTIRAYNVQQRFIATAMQQIDRNLVFYFASISSSRYSRHTPACMYNTRPHCATKSQPRNFQPLSCR